MNANFKLDTRKFQSAVRDLANLSRKKPVQTVMRQAAGQVVRRVVGVTPPANGKADVAAKKAGEAAIASDLARIFVVASAKAIRQFTDVNGTEARSQFGHKGAKAIGEVTDRVLSRSEMTSWHASRRKGNGRVAGGGNGGQTNRARAASLATGIKKSDLAALDIGIVSAADFQWFLKVLQKMVGFLAAGWNAAAVELRVKLPAWITRHGTSHGIIKITLSDHGMRIYIANAVGFVDNIPELERRLQWAVNVVAKNILTKQLPAAIKSVAKRAGFKVR